MAVAVGTVRKYPGSTFSLVPTALSSHRNFERRGKERDEYVTTYHSSTSPRKHHTIITTLDDQTLREIPITFDVIAPASPRQPEKKWAVTPPPLGAEPPNGVGDLANWLGQQPRGTKSRRQCLEPWETQSKSHKLTKNCQNGTKKTPVKLLPTIVHGKSVHTPDPKSGVFNDMPTPSVAQPGRKRLKFSTPLNGALSHAILTPSLLMATSRSLWVHPCFEPLGIHGPFTVWNRAPLTLHYHLYPRHWAPLLSSWSFELPLSCPQRIMALQCVRSMRVAFPSVPSAGHQNNGRRGFQNKSLSYRIASEGVASSTNPNLRRDIGRASEPPLRQPYSAGSHPLQADESGRRHRHRSSDGLARFTLYGKLQRKDDDYPVGTFEVPDNRHQRKQTPPPSHAAMRLPPTADSKNHWERSPGKKSRKWFFLSHLRLAFQVPRYCPPGLPGPRPSGTPHQLALSGAWLFFLHGSSSAIRRPLSRHLHPEVAIPNEAHKKPINAHQEATPAWPICLLARRLFPRMHRAILALGTQSIDWGVSRPSPGPAYIPFAAGG
ncbi:uncharacterized protein CLUP02_02562 [Colletotrichum lupini]|uniref:Uncharacterized protein n=1 Tax=Colletotrichum lupini TaxID=145971 RepID=A0A9Q8SHJ9_9PEZI|nr:uncharacterized protein CLUP02_02562 [Colletotrichum lupini]UQC77095.1 hypothetical protein CLUP02_02562 [Colletotrichum lupini]